MFFDPTSLRHPQVTNEERQQRERFTAEHYQGIKSGEIVLEIDEEREIPVAPVMDHEGLLVKRDPIFAGNSAMYFFPAGRALRSRFMLRRAGMGAPSDLSFHFKEAIPGERVHLDIEKRIGRITDPVGDRDDAGDRLRRWLEKLPHQVERLHGGQLGHAMPDQVFNLESDESFHTWAFWMARLLAGNTGGPIKQKFAAAIQNCHLLQSPDEIANTGKVLIPKLSAAGGVIDRRRFYDGPILSQPDPLTDREVQQFQSLMSMER